MKSLPRISIAIATYNGGQYLREQLQSFILQTTRPHELIVVDDGSNDDTLEIIYSFQHSAPFEVHVFQNAKTLGVSKNFELALMKCRGDLIFLSDQDDVWLPEKISTVLQFISSEGPVYGVINNAFITSHSLNTLGETTFDLKSKHGRPAWYTGGIGCCLAISANTRDLVCPIPNGRAHDIWIIQLLSVLDCLTRIEEPLQLYRRHESAVTYSQFGSIKQQSYFRVLYERIRARIVSHSSSRRKLLLGELANLRTLELRFKEFNYGDIAPTGIEKVAILRKNHQYRLAVRRMPLRTRSLLLLRAVLEGHYRSSGSVFSPIVDLLRL